MVIMLRYTLFDMGDRKVNFFANGLTSLINFGFKVSNSQSYESTFSTYSQKLYGPLTGKGILNYITSHDDSQPFDKERKTPFEAATRLLLCPGASQVYYGDETNRNLIVEGTVGDATLRSFMNWEELADNTTREGHTTQSVLQHWQKLGKFRKAHPAVGAGRHAMISESPYYFKRILQSNSFEDQVVVGLDLPAGIKEVNVTGIFANGSLVKEYYSGKSHKVTEGKLVVDTPHPVVLFGK